MNPFSIKTLLQLFKVNTATFADKILFRQANGTIAERAFSEVKDEILANSQSGGVTSVTGSSVDNTDQQNPIINAIPLTGTEEGSPVTGPIEITLIGFFAKNKTQATPIVSINDDGSRVSYSVTNRPRQIIKHPTIGNIPFRNRGAGFFFMDELNNRIEFQIGTNLNIFTEYDGTEKRVGEIVAFLSAPENSPGLVGKYDYRDNYVANSYVQKGYADMQHSYSTEETLTGGTWIDGKPIYRKVIPFTIVGSMLTIDVASLNANLFLKTDMRIFWSGFGWINSIVMPNSVQNGFTVVNAVPQNNSTEIKINSYEINISTGSMTAYTPNKTGYVILEYTKTTD